MIVDSRSVQQWADFGWPFYFDHQHGTVLMNLWDKFLGLFGLCTVNRMEQRIMHFRRCDSVTEMEWLDEIDERFHRLESQLTP